MPIQLWMNRCHCPSLSTLLGRMYVRCHSQHLLLWSGVYRQESGIDLSEATCTYSLSIGLFAAAHQSKYITQLWHHVDWIKVVTEESFTATRRLLAAPTCIIIKITENIINNIIHGWLIKFASTASTNRCSLLKSCVCLDLTLTYGEHSGWV